IHVWRWDRASDCRTRLSAARADLFRSGYDRGANCGAERAGAGTGFATPFPTAAGAGCFDPARARPPAGAGLLSDGARTTAAHARAGPRLLLSASAGAIRGRAACAIIRLAGRSASAGPGAGRPAICRVGIARTAARLAVSAGGLPVGGRAGGATRSSIHRFSRGAAGSCLSGSAGKLSDGDSAARTAERSVCWIGASPAGPWIILAELSGRDCFASRRVSAARPVCATAGPPAACVRIHNATAAGLLLSDSGLRPFDLWGHGPAAPTRSAL